MIGMQLPPWFRADGIHSAIEHGNECVVWVAVAVMVPGRTGEQCKREPDIRRVHGNQKKTQS
jgi:hypothetical protein